MLPIAGRMDSGLKVCLESDGTRMSRLLGYAVMVCTLKPSVQVSVYILVRFVKMLRAS